MRPKPVWRMPGLIGLSSLAGLLSALLGDGLWVVLSWLLLGWPVLAMLWYGLRR